MELKFRDICLRDMRESDIDDEIRWNTVETEWALWDAPWEMEVELPKFDPEAYRRETEKELREPKEDFRWSFALDTAQGIHIGSVNAYLIDENWEWISRSRVTPGQKTYRTLGIEINEHRFWSGGLGTQALAAFVKYHLDHGFSEVCLQTWSGNIRMVRCAKRLGFEVCNRETGNRQVRGETYDGLTFLLNAERFQAFLMENP